MNYFLLTLKHKYYVFLAGLKTKAPIWRLIIHDWTKFLPCELPHYQRQFFSTPDRHQPEQFIRCWLHHQNSHEHHWEYWIPRTGHNRCTPEYPDNVSIPMPEWAVREMVADWIGASMAYEGSVPKSLDEWKWFSKNFKRVAGMMHPHTVNLILKVLLDYGFELGSIYTMENIQMASGEETIWTETIK